MLLANSRKCWLAFSCGVDIFFMFVCVICLFNISDNVYSESRKLLLKWEKEALSMKSYEGLEIKKIVKSLWPLVIPMGTIGVVDKHTKNAYLEKLLDYNFNLLVIVNEA